MKVGSAPGARPGRGEAGRRGSGIGSWRGWGARDGAAFYGNLYDLNNDTYILNNEQTPTKLVYSYGKMTYGLFDKGANTLTSISKSDLYKGAEVFVYNCPVHGADFMIIYQ